MSVIVLYSLVCVINTVNQQQFEYEHVKYHMKHTLTWTTCRQDHTTIGCQVSQLYAALVAPTSSDR